MNNKRRKDLYKIIKSLEKCCGNTNIEQTKILVTGALSDTQSVLFDEEYALDNIPENLQGSERYEMSEEACYNLEMAIESLDEIIDNSSDNIADTLSEAIRFLNDAAF